ncbi:hypothetical protein CC2G_005668 [Coprinopsis cinerea AmutBmut pab1-1]|nr:hypothetical protein CC2G_005668 [Coprinopsis cinerea AmutBmut pab1-1]
MNAIKPRAFRRPLSLQIPTTHLPPKSSSHLHNHPAPSRCVDGDRFRIPLKCVATSIDSRTSWYDAPSLVEGNALIPDLRSAPEASV